MARKTSINKNELFFIATDWESDTATITTKSKDNLQENNENKLDIVGVLPDEICMKIFSFLDVKSLCRSQQTCSKWRGFIEGCASLWRNQYKIYQGLLNSIPFKRKNSENHWKAELQKVYLIQKIAQRWLAGEFSVPKSQDALPGNHIQELPVEVWGIILENELNRKKPQALRTH